MSSVTKNSTPSQETLTRLMADVTAQETSQAESILAADGLTLAEAYKRLVDHIIASGSLPYELEEPNELTCQTLEKIRRGEELFTATSREDMMRQLRED